MCLSRSLSLQGHPDSWLNDCNDLPNRMYSKRMYSKRMYSSKHNLSSRVVERLTCPVPQSHTRIDSSWLPVYSSLEPAGSAMARTACSICKNQSSGFNGRSAINQKIPRQMRLNPDPAESAPGRPTFHQFSNQCTRTVKLGFQKIFKVREQMLK